ncbi:hypothetical protein HG535_0G02210 [Zygotorulaspora mrakii]|uniref:Glutathione hydrolase n=1 Tax=Zygotorulaspora mrakii TaxID=42260 RepID=A0A7H9B6Z5_ZYGMR|nr:uncharacterized protein HG535_0G02210 [Zygotorulaspora mrakii]QLG74337.1 hypothetical protein HG535_0G02210 [Zygotorulaspora mrakii]
MRFLARSTILHMTKNRDCLNLSYRNSVYFVTLLLFALLQFTESYRIPKSFASSRYPFNVYEVSADGSDHDISIDPLLRQPTLTPDPRLLKIGAHAAISSDLEVCSNLTMSKVLQKFPGANAADAAVTQALCIGMINFFNSGVGGGGYAVFSSRNEDANLFVDFREKAPAGSHKRMFNDCPECSKIGGLAIAVPGELMGLYHLYKERGSGKVSWYDLVEPVASLGNEGWKIGEVLGACLKLYESHLISFSNEWSFVMNSTGNGVKKTGELIRREKFSNMLMELARNGSVAPFYDPQHWIAQSIVKTIQDYDGIMTADDLASYRAESGKPLSLKIRAGFRHAPDNDLTVLTSSGSSSGAALISALSILDKFESKQGDDYISKPTFELIEAMKWMASARSRLGDFDGYELPAHIKEIISQNWTDAAAEHIAMNSQDGKLQTLSNWTLYHPAYEINDPHGTAHFSIVDEFGNAVSLTTTINLLFGSMVHDPETGIIFNNEMDDFSQHDRSNSFALAPSIYNYPEPGKRPLSSAVPVIVVNELGLPDLVVGASGGSTISTSVLQAIVRSYWYKMPLLETIAYPRVHHQLLPNHVEVESFAMLGKDTIAALKSMGHQLKEQVPRSVINAIRFCDGSWCAVSDYWRKRGVSSVY